MSSEDHANIANYVNLEESSSEDEIDIYDVSQRDKTFLDKDLAGGVCRVQDFYGRVRKWLAALLTVTLIWIALLCISISIHVHYVRHCEPNDAFGKFGLGLLSFLVVRYVADSGLAILAWRQCRKILGVHAHKRLSTMQETCMEECVDGSDAGRHAICQCPDTKAARETIKMGVAIAQQRAITSSIDNLILGHNDRTGVWHSHQLRNEMLNSLNMLKLDDARDGGMLKRPHEPGGYVLRALIGVDSVSLLTCLFFMLMGTHVPSYTQSNSWCQTSYVFNWTIMTIVLLHNLLRLTPIVIRYLPFIRQ